jgi:hypothetical protein
MVLQGQAIDKGLGDRLDGERLSRLAYFIDLPIGSGQADTKPSWVGTRELRNIARHFAVLYPDIFGV